jgi:hypothetical protein
MVVGDKGMEEGMGVGSKAVVRNDLQEGSSHFQNHHNRNRKTLFLFKKLKNILNKNFF